MKTPSGAPTPEPAPAPQTAGPTWAGVELEALSWNLRLLRRHVGPRCRILAVVKADAYGHGALEISRRLVAEQIDFLCVARPQEGAELRRAALRVPVLVLGPLEAAGLQACAAHDLTPTLFDVAGLEALDRLGAERGARLGFHLKVDTGMGRLGLPMEALGDWLKALGRSKHVRLEGLFSHLASVENVRGETSRQQLERFRAAAAALQSAGHSPTLRHLAASSAVLDFPESWMEAVRPGLVLYGVHPAHGSTRLGLRPVMSVHTRVAALREVPVGSPLGYEGTFITRRRSRIAALPIGYADGLTRAHSNRGCVILGGHRAPIVGLVSMDLTLVDVTDLPAVGVGDEVILFGDEGRGRPLEDFSRDASLSPYEILCGMGPRVRRVYRQTTRGASENGDPGPQRRAASPASAGAASRAS